jgi:predicted site-specific integrase-resolvase
MKPIKVWFTLYLKEREYGGPEEGGWYYTTYTPIDSIKLTAKQTILGNDCSFEPLKSELKRLIKANIKSFIICDKISEGCVILSEKRKHLHKLLHMIYE